MGISWRNDGHWYFFADDPERTADFGLFKESANLKPQFWDSLFSKLTLRPCQLSDMVPMSKTTKNGVNFRVNK